MHTFRIGRAVPPLSLTLAASLVASLVACGGGGGDNTAPPSVVPVLSDRIEPFDPSAVPAAAKRALQAPAPARAVADAAATRAITLGPLQASRAKAGAAPAAAPGAPRRIGAPRSVANTATVAATAALLQWQPTARGTQVAALRFEAPGARGVRLGVLVQALPPGAVLRFHGVAKDAAVEVGAQELQAVAERNARGGADEVVARTYWSPDFAGPQTTLEVEIPAAAQPTAVQLAVPRLSHFMRSSAEAEDALGPVAGEAGSCQLDVTCHPEFIDQSRSVARMVFVGEDGYSYSCTGTLLNDMASSGTPYFLSASHCISSQAEASTLTTDWFYRSASCGSTVVNPATTRLTGGATLLYAAAGTDTAFMRLNDPAPAGIVYAGSYFGGVAVGSALADLHHPQGGLQKLSLGTVLRYSNCSGTECSTSNAGEGNFLTLNWQQGSTEVGSSGSAAFITIGARRYVAGQLLGGTANCATPDGVDHYGRFDTSYRAALYQWLNPGSGG